MWKHKRYKNVFKSSYRYTTGDRDFILTGIANGGKRTISFESWQAAQSLGWVKVG